LLLNACVVGAEGRATRSEILSGPPVEPLARDSALGLLAEKPGVEAPRAGGQAPRQPGALETAGYYHWNGVRYVYQGKTAEARAPAYRWR
jgi:hypothetical protein